MREIDILRRYFLYLIPWIRKGQNSRIMVFQHRAGYRSIPLLPEQRYHIHSRNQDDKETNRCILSRTMALYYCVFHALCRAYRHWAFFRSGVHRVPHDHGIIRTTVCQTCVSAIHQVSYLCRNRDSRFGYRAEGNGNSWPVFYLVILTLSSSLTMRGEDTLAGNTGQKFS